MTQQLIAIQSKGEKELSKLQKQFNTYSLKVETLKKELQHTHDLLDKARQKVNAEIIPLEKKKLDARVDILWVLDRQHDSGELKKRDREMLAAFLVEQAYVLIDHFGREDLKPLVEKHENQSFEELDRQRKEQTSDNRKKMFELFGIDIDDDTDLSDAEAFKEAYRKKIEQDNEQQATRPKTPKQLAKEEKLRQEAQNITKTVQNVYRQLVKEFHPDREQNSIERERKTLIMQRITEAYEKDDLFELLRLQLEYKQKDSGDFAILPDQQLKYYNKLLKEQVQELEAELRDLQQGNNPLQPSFYQLFCMPPQQLDANVRKAATEIKKQIKALAEEKKAFENPENTKLFLNEYRIIQKREARNSFFGFDS